jgi:N4-gp56 family major capsid protein
MRADKVVPKDGDNYLAIAHPHVLYDIMAENSATAWIGPHAYGTDTANFYNGEVGTLLGARYLRTNRVTTATDGAASAKVYRSYFVGQQAIAEGVGYDPHIVVGPVVDKLKRFNPLGWKFLGGYGLYRPQSIRKVYTASSLGALT